MDDDEDEDEDTFDTDDSITEKGKDTNHDSKKSEGTEDIPMKQKHDIKEQDALSCKISPSNDLITTTKTKNNPLQKRLLKLRMKMNQSKILNRKEILTEGERMASQEGISTERKRLMAQEKQQRKKEWESCHGKALQIFKNNQQLNRKENEIDTTKNHVKFMVEHASENIRKTSKKQNKAKINRFDVNDYYHPEGQHRNYERNLKSIPQNNTSTSSNDTITTSSNSTTTLFDISDPTHIYTGANATHSTGAKRLATEMKRRIEKSKVAQLKKRKVDFESTDINYVDKRNKHFNEKISRTYDTHTAEIRQNLERGTAL